MGIFSFLNKKSQKIGLSLSGGSMRGAAHIGVLQVLEREGIFPEVITGTSAGSIVGAAYASGISADELADIFMHTSWRELVKPAWRNALGLFDTQPMEGFITKHIGANNFSDLRIPFATVACDIMNGKRVVLNQGEVAPAVRASAAFPGLFSPVTLDGRMLIDGGVVDNMPVSLAREMGATYVIAVDVSDHGELTEPPSNMIDVLWAISNIMQARSALPSEEEIDCFIRPDVSKYSAWGFGDVESMLAAGRAAAENMIIKLKTDLKKIHPPLPHFGAPVSPLPCQ
jgi:NTE family protein